MKVILTSFRDIENFGGPFFSVARWNPKKHRRMEQVKCMAPFDPDTGEKMTTELHPEVYRVKYERLLHQNADRIRAFLDDIWTPRVVLCCWCDPERQKDLPGLYCHTILLGWWIEENTEHEVEIRDGRENPIWDRHADF